MRSDTSGAANRIPTPIEKARNLGPKTGADLRVIGVDTLEKLTTLGWCEALERIAVAFPDRANLNMARALIGAVEDVGWLEISPSDLGEARLILVEFKRRG